jgi:hypothetical protein
MTTDLMHQAILGSTDDLLRAAAARQRADRHRPNPAATPASSAHGSSDSRATNAGAMTGKVVWHVTLSLSRPRRRDRRRSSVLRPRTRGRVPEWPAYAEISRD